MAGYKRAKVFSLTFKIFFVSFTLRFLNYFGVKVRDYFVNKLISAKSAVCVRDPSTVWSNCPSGDQGRGRTRASAIEDINYSENWTSLQHCIFSHDVSWRKCLIGNWKRTTQYGRREWPSSCLTFEHLNVTNGYHKLPFLSKERRRLVSGESTRGRTRGQGWWQGCILFWRVADQSSFLKSPYVVLPDREVMTLNFPMLSTKNYEIILSIIMHLLCIFNRDFAMTWFRELPLSLRTV